MGKSARLTNKSNPSAVLVPPTSFICLVLSRPEIPKPSIAGSLTEVTGLWSKLRTDRGPGLKLGTN